MQTIFPVLRYNDAREGIRCLCDWFGFEVLFCVPPSGPGVRHAQLRLGTNIVMLGSVRPGESMKSPVALGASTMGLCVYVVDIDGHYKHAAAAGADLQSEVQQTDFGTREYHARDVEGHPWTFGTFLPSLG